MGSRQCGAKGLSAGDLAAGPVAAIVLTREAAKRPAAIGRGIGYDQASKEPRAMSSCPSALVTGLALNRFCQLIVVVSLCMICASIGGELDGLSRAILGRTGLVGLICTLGLAAVSVSRRVYERGQDETALTRRSSIAVERFVRPYVHDCSETAHPADSQTGLPGETYLWELLDYELTRAKRYGWSHSLLLVEVGSALLGSGSSSGARARRLAERLSSVLRAGDTMVRLDQTRFAALLPHTDAKTLEPIARRVKAELAELVSEWSAGQHDESARHESPHIVGLAASQPQWKVRVATAVFPADGQRADTLLAKLMHNSLTSPARLTSFGLEAAAS